MLPPMPPKESEPHKIRIDPRNMMPVAADPQNERRVGSRQHVHLSTERVRSTIPKGDFTPEHQKNGLEPGESDGRWVYPSEQMFYNAMERKGWDPNAEDMRSVIAIHNAVNERTWGEVLKWERRHVPPGTAQGDGPRLVRFMGRPQDLSPKARFRSWIGYNKPFDRHDWFVQRPWDGDKEVRYVIDFYGGNQADLPEEGKRPIAFHLDVRPACDSVDAVLDRARMWWSE